MFYVHILTYMFKICQNMHIKNAIYAEKFKICNSASPISDHSCSILASPTLAPTTPDSFKSQTMYCLSTHLPVGDSEDGHLAGLAPPGL